MITTGSKYFYGAGALLLVGAFFYAIATSGNEVGMNSLTGAISLGYKGGVGDHVGYAILVALAGASLLVGGVLTAVRDADPEATAELIGLEVPAPVDVPSGVSYWPLLAAFGAAVVIFGLIEGAAVFVMGLIVCGIVAIEWAVRSWSDRATHNSAANRTVRNRMLNPLEIPLMAILGIVVRVRDLSGALGGARVRCRLGLRRCADGRVRRGHPPQRSARDQPQAGRRSSGRGGGCRTRGGDRGLGVGST